jgi:hypothetical protein
MVMSEIIFEFPEAPQINFMTDLQGESLYQKWLELGNVGDHEAFLEWLREPAAEAADYLEAAELIRLSNEAARSQAENARQSSETSREEAELLREQAKTETIAATEAATTAAEAANAAKGWTPAVVFEEYNGTLIKKLVGYVGGTGITPTDNVGLYFAAGGFTADKDSALDFKGSIGETVVNVNQARPLRTLKYG